MATEIQICWPLKRYARCMRTGNQLNDDENWTLIQAENGDLTLSYLKTEQVIVTKNDIIEESFSLTSKKEFLRGISKGDSLLIISKYESAIRKFRVQFDETNERSGLQGCQEFVKIFGIYFPVSSTPSEYKQESVLSQKEALSGEVAAGSILKAVQGEAELPLPYNQPAPQFDSNTIKTFIYSCLFDPSFPKFVHDVESILKDIVNN